MAGRARVSAARVGPSVRKHFGGFQLFETEPDAPALVVGAFACLADGVYKGREGELVPVIFASDDVIYSLDAEGRGFTCAAMVEGVSRPSADSGEQLLSQAILWRRVATHSETLRDLEGARGAELAAELGLEPLPEASSEFERWWGKGESLVVEIAQGNGYAGPRAYALA